MSHTLYPFENLEAVKTYAILLDRQVGVLAAWKFMLERGFAPEDIVLTLAPLPEPAALEESQS
ncbi:hypothetical protein GCM10027277_33430 [Pseudoduganella ginsengisoli]